MSTVVQRISIDSSSITYQNAEILDKSEWKNVPNLFEDSQIVFRSDKKTFVLPDYNIYLIQVRGGRISGIPANARRVSRVLIAGDLNYADCYLITPEMYSALGVPQIFRPYEQFVWACKDGLFITVDFNIIYVTL